MQWKGALWNRVRAKDCDLTELDLTSAQLLRCELGPVRMARVRFHRARIQDTTFKDSELYSADFAAAILIKEAIGIKSGSGEPHVNKVGKISMDQVRQIAERKMPDLNANDLDAASKIIAGTPRSMGVDVE